MSDEFKKMMKEIGLDDDQLEAFIKDPLAQEMQSLAQEMQKAEKAMPGITGKLIARIEQFKMHDDALRQDAANRHMIETQDQIRAILTARPKFTQGQLVERVNPVMDYLSEGCPSIAMFDKYIPHQMTCNMPSVNLSTSLLGNPIAATQFDCVLFVCSEDGELEPLLTEARFWKALET